MNPTRRDLLRLRLSGGALPEGAPRDVATLPEPGAVVSGRSAASAWTADLGCAAELGPGGLPYAESAPPGALRG